MDRAPCRSALRRPSTHPQPLPTHGKGLSPPAGRVGGTDLLRSLTDVAVRPALVWRYAFTPRPRGTAVRKPGTRGRKGLRRPRPVSSVGGRSRGGPRRIIRPSGTTTGPPDPSARMRRASGLRRAARPGWRLSRCRPGSQRPAEARRVGVRAAQLPRSRRVGSGRRAVARHNQTARKGTRSPTAPAPHPRRTRMRLIREADPHADHLRGGNAPAGRFALGG